MIQVAWLVDVLIEHPTGEMTVVGHVDAAGNLGRVEVLRTARKLMDGTVFPVPA